MKKFIKFIVDPVKSILLLIILFSISFIDSILNDASSYAELGLVGKTGFILFLILFTVTAFRFLFVPLYHYIKELLK